MIALDLDGIAVSAGAACSSGKVARSHVLAAMGLGALAGEAIRVSLPWNATAADVEAFAAAYQRMAARLRAVPGAARRLTPHCRHDQRRHAAARTVRSISTTRPPRAATRACWR